MRRFDQPHKYKPFVSRCVMKGDVGIGCVREVDVKSGLPATTSTEKLELLDDTDHILGIKILGGDHRLKVFPLFRSSITKLFPSSMFQCSNWIHLLVLQNYSSVVTVHPEIIDGIAGTMVIESFVVDVPQGNTRDETCYFVEALIRCNLKSLSNVCERMAAQDRI